MSFTVFLSLRSFVSTLISDRTMWRAEKWSAARGCVRQRGDAAVCVTLLLWFLPKNQAVSPQCPTDPPPFCLFSLMSFSRSCSQSDGLKEAMRKVKKTSRNDRRQRMGRASGTNLQRQVRHPFFASSWQWPFLFHHVIHPSSSVCGHAVPLLTFMWGTTQHMQFCTLQLVTWSFLAQQQSQNHQFNSQLVHKKQLTPYRHFNHQTEWLTQQ